MLGISVWAFVEPAILKRVFEKLTLPPCEAGLICAIWPAEMGRRKRDLRTNQCRRNIEVHAVSLSDERAAPSD